MTLPHHRYRYRITLAGWTMLATLAFWIVVAIVLVKCT
jgi:hypothetical protein